MGNPVLNTAVSLNRFAKGDGEWYKEPSPFIEHS
jgi:hypothetical protein